LGVTKQQNGPRGRMKVPPWTLRRSLLSVAIPIELRPREILFHAGDRGDGCYFLREGAVKASVVARDGQERLLAILGPGALIGELALIDDEPRSATVSALRRCTLLHLTKASFFRLADANPMIYREALKILAHRLRDSNQSVLAHGTITVSGRVARAFIALADSLGEEIKGGRTLLPHRITQSDIAGVAGVARENASRIINELLRDGILGREGSFYVIERLATLDEMAEI
jgi:CRP/FNR family cyclic AMP-dependent transcriptional regulator